MDLLYKTIEENPDKEYTGKIDTLNYRSIWVSLSEFTSPGFAYGTEGLWYSEYYKLSLLERTPQIEAILCLFNMRERDYDDHIDPKLFDPFIRKNKHILIKMLQNSFHFLKFHPIDGLFPIFEGDKYLFKRLRKMLRWNTILEDWNHIQAYCQANYGSFHTHNDWDLDFIYSEHSSCL